MSYVSNSDADLYFESRYESDLWNNVSEDDKTKLEVTARRLINNLNFAGDKHDSSQSDEFPRGDDTDVPQAIKDACCEIMYALLDGRNVEFEQELIGDTLAVTSNIRRNIDAGTVDVARVHGIPSIVAWNLLRPYLRDGSVITLSRVG
jgi:hypothetical protein